MNVTGIVLAAGFGTRLRPSTEYCPKPLIPVAGIEPLFHAIYQLQELGIKNVVVNAHYLPEKIEHALMGWESLFPGMKLHLCVEDEILGTGGAIQNILKKFPKLFEGKALMLLNGDTLARIPIGKFLENPTQSSFAYSENAEHMEKYKPLWMGEDKTWLGIGPTPPTKESKPVHFLGVHIISSNDLVKVVEALPEIVEYSDLFNGIYRPLVNEGSNIFGICMLGPEDVYSDFCYWFDMTNREFLLEAQKFLLGTNGPAPDWQGILKTRFPGIKEVSSGVWADFLQVENVKFVAPSICVDNSRGTLKNTFKDMELGPHACLICEEICDEVSDSLRASSPKHVSVKNSVLFLTDKLKEQPPTDVLDEVRVW